MIIAEGKTEIVAGFWVGCVAPAPGEVTPAILNDQLVRISIHGFVAPRPFAVDQLARRIVIDDQRPFLYEKKCESADPDPPLRRRYKTKWVPSLVKAG